MNFIDLPIEVGILLITYLDTKSKINLYGSCSAVQCFFAPCHVNKFVVSRSSIATVRTLDTDLFNNFRNYIQELDLSGVANLTADIFKNYVSELKKLKALDVTFTNIYLNDLPEICPEGLKILAINFFKCPRKSYKDGTWHKCIDVFKQKRFEKIHFILFEFLDSDIPLIFLKTAPAIKLVTITVADNYKDFSELEEMSLSMSDNFELDFSQLSYIFKDCRVTHKTSECLKGIMGLNFKKLEYIFVMYSEQILIYVSPALKSVFSVNFSDIRVEIRPYLPADFELDGNIVFKAWNKSTTVLNERFFETLLKELRDYFPKYICMHKELEMNITKAKSNWYCIDSCEGFETKLDYLPNNVTLTNFCRKKGGIDSSNRPICLSPDAKTLKNITFIRLSYISISKKFFTSLFVECSKLRTLDISLEKRNRSSGYRRYTASLAVAIQFAQSLKNVKLTSEDIEYELLFATLSQCCTLENIHVCEYERSLDDIDDNVDSMLTLIENCKELYSLFIEADMSPEALTMMVSPLRELSQNLERDHLVIEVCDYYSGGWNPFVNVFNPSPLHILE